MFQSIFANGSVTTAGIFSMLFAAFVSGAIFAALSCSDARSSKTLMVTTALLPMSVAMVIALVNGNIGAGVATAGAFGLVRFRSAPGTAKEICIIFIAMAAGLAFGMGYLGYGCAFLLIMGILLFLAQLLHLLDRKPQLMDKTIKITIPENLDYTAVFDDIFTKYTKEFDLQQVKSMNMGSLFRLNYHIVLKQGVNEKEMLDEIRCRNGNLDIILTRTDLQSAEL